MARLRLVATTAARWPWRPILGLVAETEPSSQYAAFHAGIARPILHMLANAVEFMWTTPPAGHIVTS